LPRRSVLGLRKHATQIEQHIAAHDLGLLLSSPQFDPNVRIESRQQFEIWRDGQSGHHVILERGKTQLAAKA